MAASTLPQTQTPDRNRSAMTRAVPSITPRVTPDPPGTICGTFADLAGKSDANRLDIAGQMCSLQFFANATISGDLGSPQSRAAAVTAAATNRNACFRNLILNGNSGDKNAARVGQNSSSRPANGGPRTNRRSAAIEAKSNTCAASSLSSNKSATSSSFNETSISSSPLPSARSARSSAMDA